MKKTSVSPTPRFFLQLSVAAYFLLYGLVGIAYNDSGISSTWGRALFQGFGARNDALNLIIAILTLVAGVILLIGLFLKLEANLQYAAGLGIFIFWAVRILYIFLVRIPPGSYFLVWLEQLALDLVVLAAVWLVTRKYS
jgi:hypothetical protein